MKVEGSDKTSGSKKAPRTRAKKCSGEGVFDSMIDTTGEIKAQPSVVCAASVGALDSLLALQREEGSASKESKARKRASDLLEHLEKVRLGLLAGALSKDVLSQLAYTVSTHREKVMDPKLVEILDEIDLRAQVELAKLETVNY